MINYKGVSEFADKYDAFILDIWGVIHDGYATYPNVVECLEELKKRNKKILFLSNAPRRSAKVKSVLEKFGITKDLYLDAVSSGEASYHYVKSSAWGKKYFYIGPEKDRDLLNGLNLQEVANAKDAEFAITTGFDGDNSTLDEKMEQIEQALEAGLTLICANPDRLVVRQDGSKMLCAGVIGEFYQEQAGEVIFIGKPYPLVYEKCMEILGLPKEKICAVGDNLDTDILGANNFGIDSVLCLGGVLKVENKPAEEVIKQLGITPKITIPAFNW